MREERYNCSKLITRKVETEIVFVRRSCEGKNKSTNLIQSKNEKEKDNKKRKKNKD